MDSFSVATDELFCWVDAERMYASLLVKRNIYRKMRAQEKERKRMRLENVTSAENKTVKREKSTF